MNVGDTKDMSLSTNEVLTMQIYGFDHDPKADGTGTTNITFGTKNLMAATKLLVSANYNQGGWNPSELRTWTNGTLYNQLPLDVKNG